MQETMRRDIRGEEVIEAIGRLAFGVVLRPGSDADTLV